MLPLLSHSLKSLLKSFKMEKTSLEPWPKPGRSSSFPEFAVNVPIPHGLAEMPLDPPGFYDSILPKSTLDIPQPKLPNLLPKTFVFEKHGDKYYLMSREVRSKEEGGGERFIFLAQFLDYECMQTMKEILGKSIECGQTRREMGI